MYYWHFHYKNVYLYFNIFLGGFGVHYLTIVETLTGDTTTFWASIVGSKIICFYKVDLYRCLQS